MGGQGGEERLWACKLFEEKCLNGSYTPTRPGGAFVWRPLCACAGYPAIEDACVTTGRRWCSSCCIAPLCSWMSFSSQSVSERLPFKACAWTPPATASLGARIAIYRMSPPGAVARICARLWGYAQAHTNCTHEQRRHAAAAQAQHRTVQSLNLKWLSLSGIYAFLQTSLF